MLVNRAQLREPLFADSHKYASMVKMSKNYTLLFSPKEKKMKTGEI
jgi:hypothetical protein